MAGNFKLIDYIRVTPDHSLGELSVREKVTFMDSIFSHNRIDKGLLITYDLSHSGRRINNRIYTTKGQQDGINTITHPYPKPILVHHDGGSDPIGRFASGRWEDLSSEGMRFFDSIENFMEFQKSFDSNDPEKIYHSMKTNNLLTNKDWPGLGRMRVQARITDEKAVEKFLDGRYVTFSAGSTTDRHVCSICNEDWAQGDLCEHRHGKIYDGEVCVFITGTFEVLEGSVVNMPADDLSQVLSMEMLDNPGVAFNGDSCKIDEDTVYLSDSIYNITEINMPETNTAEISSEVSEDSVSTEVDTAGTQQETTETTTEVTGTTTEGTSEVTTTETTETGTTTETTTVAEVTETEGETTTTETETTTGTTETTVAEVSTAGDSADCETNNDEIVKYVFDAVLKQLNPLLGNLLNTEADAKLTTAEREKLKPESKADDGTETVETVLSASETSDYVIALKKIQELEAQLTSVLDRLTKEKNVKFADSEDRQTEMLNWFNSLDEETTFEEVEKTVETIDNPSVASAENLGLDKTNLGGFEQSIVNKYFKIFDSDGSDAAERFLVSRRRYLPRGFHPSNFKV